LRTLQREAFARQVEPRDAAFAWLLRNEVSRPDAVLVARPRFDGEGTVWTLEWIALDEGSTKP